MIKKISLFTFSLVILLFGFFSVTQKVEAQFGGCEKLTYGTKVNQVDCNPGASCVPTTRCTFTTGVPGGPYRCELDRTTSYKTVTTTCNGSNQVVSSETACGPSVTTFCNAYVTQTGCYSNSDCPHPPGSQCDTYCDLSAGTPGSCVQNDPLCSMGGAGAFYCGDGQCTAGETNANCAADCPVTPPPPDFVITVDPTQRSITQGGSTSYIVTVNPVSTFNAKVALDAICPSGATCQITANAHPTSGEPGTVDLAYGAQTATLVVSNTSGISIGNFSIDVTGLNGSTRHHVYPQLKVVPGQVGSFTANVGSGCPARNISLAWGAGQGANAYRLYRNTVNAMPATPYKVVGNVTSDTDFPAVGLTYYYWIESSHSPSGNYSAAVLAGPVTLDACPPPPTVTFNASPTSGTAPVTTTLSWSTTGSPTSCTAGGAWSGSKAGGGGSQVISGINTASTFTLYCTNVSGHSTTASVTITPVGTISVSISASPSSMSLPTNSTTLTWTTTGNPTSCTASNYWSGSKTASGGSEVRTGMTAQTYTFTITCSKAGVPDATATVVVPVAAAPTPISISSFTPYYASITNYPTIDNNSVYWTTTGNPTSCVASGSSPWGSGAGTAAVNASLATGSHYQGTYPSVGTYTYTLTCSKAGVADATATFTVPVSSSAPTGTLSPAAPTCTIASGASSCTVNLTWTTTNPIGTSAITAVGMANYNGNSGTNVAFTVPFSSRVFYLYNNAALLATSNATANCVSGTVWNGSVCQVSGGGSSSRIVGKVCKDDNQDGVCSGGEVHVRDVSIGACANSSSAQSGFTINYGGPASGTQLLNVCGSLGDPVFDMTALPAGTYSVTLSLPPGWSYVANGCQQNSGGVFVPCASAVTAVVNVTTGGTGVVLFAAKAPVTPTYTLTVNKTIGGSVTTTDGLVSCGSTCTRAYNQGTMVTLQAVPDTVQWRFVGWSGACSGTGSCTLTIDGNKNVTAQFRPRALLYQEF